MDQQTLTRGQLAKQTGKSFETIRFYEDKGLLSHAFRDSSNYRRYRPSDSDRLLFIDKAKDLGFSLREISEILDIHDHEDGGCKNLAEKAKLKLAEIDAQIAELERRKALLHRFDSCSALELVNCECDIIALANDEKDGCSCSD